MTKGTKADIIWRKRLKYLPVEAGTVGTPRKKRKFQKFQHHKIIQKFCGLFIQISCHKLTPSCT